MPAEGHPDRRVAQQARIVEHALPGVRQPTQKGVANYIRKRMSKRLPKDERELVALLCDEGATPTDLQAFVRMAIVELADDYREGLLDTPEYHPQLVRLLSEFRKAVQLQLTAEKMRQVEITRKIYNTPTMVDSARLMVSLPESGDSMGDKLEID